MNNDRMSTEEVRAIVAWDHYNDEPWPERGRKFDRWLAEIRRSERSKGRTDMVSKTEDKITVEPYSGPTHTGEPAFTHNGVQGLTSVIGKWSDDKLLTEALRARFAGYPNRKNLPAALYHERTGKSPFGGRWYLAGGW